MGKGRAPSAAEAPVLVVVSEHADLFAAVRPDRHEVVHWRPQLPDGAAAPDLRLFAGDPTQPSTYTALEGLGPDPVAVLDLRGRDRTLAAARALRTVAPDAALLILSDEPPAEPSANALVRHIAWPELLRVDLEAELTRLDRQRRVQRLRAFAKGAGTVPILLQIDPDPDGLASALAVRALLRRRAATAPIVALGRITRPENRRMSELLRNRVTRVTRAELSRFERVIAVDVQPVGLRVAGTRFAVIDHHPAEGGYRAEYVDIRDDYGATATLLTEYLRADDEGRIGRRLATALLYGIVTDTARLSRGVAQADIDAFAFLHTRADHALLGRIARPVYARLAARAFGSALAGLVVDRELAVAHLGTVPADQAHIMADLADYCVLVEGVATVAVGAVVGDDFFITLRHRGGGPGAGALARRLAGEHGVGGGHASMARVTLAAADAVKPATGPAAARALARRVRAALSGLE